MSYLVAAMASAAYTAKIRKKKPFNAMLGETYEMVTDRFIFLAEKT